MNTNNHKQARHYYLNYQKPALFLCKCLLNGSGQNKQNDQPGVWQFPSKQQHWTKNDFVIRGFREQTKEEGRKPANGIEWVYELLSRHVSPSLLPAGDNGDHPSSCPPLRHIFGPLICIQVSWEIPHVLSNNYDVEDLVGGDFSIPAILGKNGKWSVFI